MAKLGLSGSVPPSVASLWDGLARAGLLTSLELLFELEMLEDELYVDATAGWGAKSGEKTMDISLSCCWGSSEMLCVVHAICCT
eukprot:scaffold236482_cov22-Tisochrysis_lutea.AAC.1